MMDVRIKQLKKRFRLPFSKLNEEQRLDALLMNNVIEMLPRMLAEQGIPPESELCIRQLNIPVALKLSNSDHALARRWCSAVGEAVAQVLKSGGGDVFFFRSRNQALIRCVEEIAQGDFAHAWAWEGLGIANFEGPPTVGRAMTNFLTLLAQEEEKIVPVLNHAASRNLLKKFVSVVDGGLLRKLAYGALKKARVSGTPQIKENNGDLQYKALAIRVLKQSKIMRGFINFYPGFGTDKTMVESVAILSLLDVEPAFAQMSDLRMRSAVDALSGIIVKKRKWGQDRSAFDQLVTDENRKFTAEEPHRESSYGHNGYGKDQPAGSPELERGEEDGSLGAKEQKFDEYDPAKNLEEPDAMMDNRVDEFFPSQYPAFEPFSKEPTSHSRTSKPGAGSLDAKEQKFDEYDPAKDPEEPDAMMDNRADEFFPSQYPAFEPFSKEPASHSRAPKPGDRGQEKPLPPGDEQPEETQLDSCSALGVSKEEVFTEWGGLFFLINIMNHLSLPQKITQTPLFEERGMKWILCCLAAGLIPAGNDDPAILTFCGIAPTEKTAGFSMMSLPNDFRTMESLETPIVEWQRQILKCLGELLPWQDMPEDMLMDKLCRRKAWIISDPGWFQIHMELEEVSVDVRRAGLDLDPGYVPWLGVVIKFHYS